MCETQIVLQNGRVAGTLSWTVGFVELSPPPMKWTDTDVLARCIYLEKHGRQQEALELLDRYLSSKKSVYGLNVSAF